MRRSRGKSERGQSLLEFAIVFPVFMFILGGAVQFGVIFWGQNTLTQIVRDGGRYAATVTKCDGTKAADVIAATASVAAGTFLHSSLAVATPAWSAATCPTTNDAGHAVWVTVSATADVPIFFPWVPGNGHIASTSEYRVEPVQP